MWKDLEKAITPEQVGTVEEWVEDILPLTDKYPRLREVDLIIEGGVGGGTTMPQIAQRIFPEALYVGTDIASVLMSSQPRLRGSIDDESLRKVQEANNHPSWGMRAAIVRANCFDEDLIRDILRKTGRHNPFLVTFKALNAIGDRKMNPWERKEEYDIVTADQSLGLDSPYVGQIHMPEFWEDEPSDSFSSRFHSLEKGAQGRGWATERFDCGLLLLKPGLGF